MPRPHAPVTSHPLAGLRVLDFTRVLAGPFASRLLADLGADVVKVEPPEGDITRIWGRVTGGVPGYFHQQNAGKSNISIDLHAPGAADLVHELVRRADIVMENFRPDVMARLGIGWSTLQALNPRLIMLSISGFGANGPESDRPAYAPIIHAEAGLIARSAARSGGELRDLPLSVADTNASLHGLVGLLAALYERERTGLGQHIEIAMIDATVATDDQLHFDVEQSFGPGPQPNEIWSTGCGPILIAGDFRLLWKQLNRRHGLQDGTPDDAPLAERIAARRAAAARFLATLQTYDAVAAAMAKMNLAWGRVRDPADVPNQATVRARGALVPVDDRAGGTRPTWQSPYRFSRTASGVRGATSHRGEDNRQVLQDWLGLDADAVGGLEQAGVLQRDPELPDGATPRAAAAPDAL